MNAMPPNSLTTLRLGLLANGYTPIPVTAPDFNHPKVKSPGKQPFFKDWQKVSRDTLDEATVRGWPAKVRNHPNTGLLCGELVGLDIDVPLEDVSAQIQHMALAMLGATPLRRIGKAPKALLCYRAAAPMAKAETPELKLADGTALQIEAMGVGQQIVGFGIHPATGMSYVWPDGTPERIPLSDLPVVSETALRGFLAAAEAVLRQTGALTDQEREKAAAAAPIPEPQPLRSRPAPTSKSGQGGGSEFFQATNKAALGNIGSWLPAIFPRAEEQTGSGLTRGAWRVSSAELGRSLEEDLSIHPVSGGHDFGTRKSCSAIDVVLQWGGVPSARDAAFWLCEKLGTDPAGLGWREPRAKKDRPKREVRQPTGLPTIQITAGELHTNTTSAEDAIIQARVAIFQRGSSLVQPISREVPAADGRTTLAAGLSDINVHTLVDVLCAVAEWERYDARAGAMVRTNPPAQVAHILLSRFGRWRVPAVAGVVTTPTMRADGSILSAPGYDPATRLYHVADPTLKLHPAIANPTRDHALAALKALNGLLAEFPFVVTKGDGKPDQHVSKAVALSALITPVVRGAVPVAPMHVFRAPTPGTGKSYLADVSSAITTGRACPVIAAAASEEETEKRLVGLLLAGFPIISLDNVNGELGGDLLCQAIERPLVRVRPLGRSDIVEIESKSTILGTGNNLRVRGDMVRRTLVSDLDANMEQPEEREFKGDPVATVQGDRGRYVSACLVIVRAYMLAGSPGKMPPIASFEAWSGLVRSALVWLGCADPALSMKAAREDDPELGDMREVMAAWHEAFGSMPMTVRRAVEAAITQTPQPDENGDIPERGARLALPHPQLQDAFLRIAGLRGAIDAKKLGQWVQTHQGRIVSTEAFPNGLRFAKDGETQGSARWKLTPPRRDGGGPGG